MTCAGEVKKERKNKGEGGTWVVGQKRKEKRKKKRNGRWRTWVVGEKRKEKRKKNEGIYNVGRGKKKMRKKYILGVVKKK